MRAIKFRAKSKEDKEFVYGYYFKTEGKYYILQEMLKGLQKFEVIPETIGQFTGICDKNVKEIYKDDIVIYNYYGNIIRGVVVFKDLAYHIKYKDQDIFDAYLRIYDWSGEYIKVIGNIHENPELLEQ